MATMNSIGTAMPIEVSKGGIGADTLTDHGVLFGSGTGAITAATVMTDGQLLVGSSAADPAPHTITSSDSTIAFTTGGGTLSFQARAGTEAVTGVVEFASGAETTTATSDALAVHPAGLNTRLGTQTQYGVMLGGGGAGSNLGVTAAGDAGKILRGAGASNPDWTTWTIAATMAQGDIIYASAANVMTALTKDANATRYLANTGADNSPAWGQVDMTNGVTGTLPVGNGGTGVADPTDHSLLVGSGAAAMTELGVATDGQLVIGSSGADPVLATLTAGAGISITNAGGSITVTATASGLGYAEVTETTQQAVVDYVYTCNNAGLVTVTLPDTAAEGSMIGIIGKGTGGWKVAQNAGETIKFGTATSTEGVGGSLASTDDNDVIYLVCITADVLWTVVQSVGNITIV